VSARRRRSRKTQAGGPQPTVAADKRFARVYERSAGGLVLRRVGAHFEGLVIGRSMPRIWSLPKGHIEPNETVEDAAVREVEEETGVRAAIVTKLDAIRYWFYANRAKHNKVVHFFLMRYIGGQPTPQKGEVDEARWVPLDDMPALLTHVNERKLAEAAAKIVKEQPALM
jgi:8-oxo-dGTP pyrophosphatase MutT (NUDIX family)